MTIAATPARIWETIRLEAGKQYYNPVVQKVERLGESGEVYRLDCFLDRRCAGCGLFQHAETASFHFVVEIIESIEHAHLRTRSEHPAFPVALRWNVADFVEELFEIRPIGPAVCKVTQRNCVMRPALMLAATLKLGDPVGQYLANLKGFLEGGGNDTLGNGASPNRSSSPSRDILHLFVIK